MKNIKKLKKFIKNNIWMPYGVDDVWLVKTDIWIWNVVKAMNIVNMRNTRKLNRLKK